MRTTSINEFYKNSTKDIEVKMSEFMKNGLDWTFKSANNLELRLNRFNLISGSSYIELTKEIKDKKVVINVNNKGQEWFKWAIKLGLYTLNEDTQRVFKHKHILEWELMKH